MQRSGRWSEGPVQDSQLSRSVLVICFARVFWDHESQINSR
jgi:hypothetical protein